MPRGRLLTASGLDGYPGPTDDWNDLFVVKCNTLGDWIWSYEMSRPGPDLVYAAGVVQGNIADNHVTYDVAVPKFDQLVCN